MACCCGAKEVPCRGTYRDAGLKSESSSHYYECSSCGDVTYSKSLEGKRCRASVCSKTGQRTWVGCREYEKQLNAR